MRSMPSCLMTSRCTSATVTLSITWSRPRTVRLLTTLSALPTSATATSKACCDSVGVRDAARQHDAVADAVDAHVRVRQQLLQHRAHAVEVARDRDVEAGDLPAVGVEEIDVGLADRDADQVGAARRAHDRVGDLRLRDQHVLDVARQVDHHRLADAELHEARRGIASRPPGSARARRGHDAGGLAGARVSAAPKHAAASTASRAPPVSSSASPYHSSPTELISAWTWC